MVIVFHRSKKRSFRIVHHSGTPANKRWWWFQAKWSSVSFIKTVVLSRDRRLSSVPSSLLPFLLDQDTANFFLFIRQFIYIKWQKLWHSSVYSPLNFACKWILQRIKKTHTHISNIHTRPLNILICLLKIFKKHFFFHRAMPVITFSFLAPHTFFSFNHLGQVESPNVHSCTQNVKRCKI